MAAGLVLDEPSSPTSASVADVVKDLSNALERLHVAFGSPKTAGGGDKDTATRRPQCSADEEAQGIRGGLQMGQAPETRLVVLRPVDDKSGYFKLSHLPASAATLLRGITAEEVGSLFYKFIGENLTEERVMRILEAYAMKIRSGRRRCGRPNFSRTRFCPGTESVPYSSWRASQCGSSSVTGGEAQSSGEPPPTMANTVPLDLRVDIRQSLTMGR